MKQILLLVCIVWIAGCKKDDDDTLKLPVQYKPLTDFKFIPIKDAEWNIHTQGIYKNGSVDMSVHFHTTVTCSGTDTMALGRKYYRYNYTNENGSGVIYIREDTTRKTLYALAPGFAAPEGAVVDFGLDSVGDPAKVAQQWPPSIVYAEDSLIIAGQYMKSWEGAYEYDKTKRFFYRAYGVGGQTGILPSLWIAQGTQPVSLDFTYKGEKVHFDFDVY